MNLVSIKTEALGDYVSEASVFIETFRIKCQLHGIWNRFHLNLGKCFQKNLPIATEKSFVEGVGLALPACRLYTIASV